VLFRSICSRATRFAERRSDAAGKSFRSRAEPPRRLLCRALAGKFRPEFADARVKKDAFVRLRWSHEGPRETAAVSSVAKAPGFVRRLHRSRGGSEGGPRGVERPGPLRVFLVALSSDTGVRFRFEQASRAPRAGLVGSERPAERELDSQPGNRCSAARRPSLADADPSGTARGVTGRSRVCSTFTFVADSRRALPVRRTLAERRRSGSPSAGTVHAVRREAARKGASEESRLAR
jgi:hypothetical protein